MFFPISVTLAATLYTDCERPPEVDHASSLLAVDDNEEFVTATYKCHDGYKMAGRNEMTCDLDTDEWQGKPPICEPGGKNAII